jgi:hypothetical protein
MSLRYVGSSLKFFQILFWVNVLNIFHRVYQLINLISDRIAALKTEAYIASCVTDLAVRNAHFKHTLIKIASNHEIEICRKSFSTVLKIKPGARNAHQLP